jgi:hypothetical protein
MKNSDNVPGEVLRVKDQEARKMLAVLAKNDNRPAGNMVAWLIRQEHARRYSEPQPVITVADAQTTAARI